MDDARVSQAQSRNSESGTPNQFKVKFETTKGDFVIEVSRGWSPNGSDRFYELVQNRFYDECRFFRVLDGFMAQFGIHGDPAVQAKWRDTNILDDPVEQSNRRGFVTFATSGPNSRTTQLFINFSDRNKFLDSDGFSPFGKVIEGMDVVDSLYNGYGEGPPDGSGPDQSRVQREGNEYLKAEFPKLDYIKRATLLND